MPTTVSACLPTVIVEPSWPGAFALREHDLAVVRRPSGPAASVRSSTGRRARAADEVQRGGDRAAVTPGMLIWAVTLSVANGPATAVTPRVCAAFAICAAEARGRVHGDGDVRAVL